MQPDAAMRTLIAIALLTLTTPVLAAGLCDKPPYGSSGPKLYEVYVAMFGADYVKPLLPNICRAKFKGDARMRKQLTNMGISNDVIDHEDVTLIAAKVLKAAMPAR
jgi:hypothetical protein